MRLLLNNHIYYTQTGVRVTRNRNFQSIDGMAQFVGRNATQWASYIEFLREHRPSRECRVELRFNDFVIGWINLLKIHTSSVSYSFHIKCRSPERQKRQKMSMAIIKNAKRQKHLPLKMFPRRAMEMFWMIQVSMKKPVFDRWEKVLKTSAEKWNVRMMCTFVMLQVRIDLSECAIKLWKFF